MKIDVIIPNYNGADLITRNLPSVFEALTPYDGKIIIVDDGSTTHERQKLKDVISKFEKRKNEIILIQKVKNSGFSSTVNAGVGASRADFVVLLNSDVSPSINFLKSPLEKLRDDKNIFGVGCMDESVEGNMKIRRGRGLARWSKGFLMHSRGEVDRNDTFWISGGSSVIRRELFNKLGGMDTIYSPFYWEDIDLSFLAQKAGYAVVFDPESVVVHRHEDGAIKKHYNEDKIRTVSYRNQIIFVWKNITSKKLLIDHLFRLPIHLVGAVLRFDMPFIKGLFLAMSLLPAIIKKRRIQKILYQLSDESVIKNIS